MSVRWLSLTLLFAVGVCCCATPGWSQALDSNELAIGQSEVVEGNAGTAIDFDYQRRQTAEHQLPGTNPAGETPAMAPLPLARPGQGGAGQSVSDTAGQHAPPSRANSISTVISSLAIVLGLFFGIVWVAKRHAPKGSTVLPTDVVESLGRAPLAGRQQMQLVRVGEKLLLVAVSATGAQTLTEVTDPDEVTRLTTACEDSRGGSASSSFRQTLGELSAESTPRGFFGRLAGTGSDAGGTTGGLS